MAKREMKRYDPGEFWPEAKPLSELDETDWCFLNMAEKAKEERIMRTLEEYFKENLKGNVIDFSLRAQETGDGIEFYIHPMNRDGDTMDFSVRGNMLTTKIDIKS